MGPVIILDKSALEGLKGEELLWLNEYFSVNLVPVLVMELLGDLKHPNSSAEAARQRVRGLAAKVLAAQAYPNEHFQKISIHELLGVRVSMNCQVLIGGRRAEIALPSGGFGEVIDTQDENQALARWSEGDFDTVDEVLAERWRTVVRSLDLEAFKARFRALRTPGMTLNAIVDQIDSILNDVDAAPSVAGWWMIEMGLGTQRATAFMRWFAQKRISLADAAPFSAHCARSLMTLYSGVIQDLIGSRSTNRVDIEYFFYTPFAHVLCADDKLFEQLVPFLLPKRSSFVKRDTLKAELAALVARAAADPNLSGLSVAEQSEKLAPPDDGVIAEQWRRHFGKWSPRSDRVANNADASAKASPDDKLLQEIQKAISDHEKGTLGSPAQAFRSPGASPRFTMYKRVGARWIEKKRFGTRLPDKPMP